MTTDQTSPLDYPVPDKADANPPRKAGDPNWQGSVLYGLGIVAALHIVINGGAAIFGWPLFVAVGLVQLVYLVPAWIILRRQGQRRTALGVVIGAAVTFVLNSACWGAVAIMFQKLH